MLSGFELLTYLPGYRDSDNQHSQHRECIKFYVICVGRRDYGRGRVQTKLGDRGQGTGEQGDNRETGKRVAYNYGRALVTVGTMV